MLYDFTEVSFLIPKMDYTAALSIYYSKVVLVFCFVQVDSFSSGLASDIGSFKGVVVQTYSVSGRQIRRNQFSCMGTRHARS